MMFFLVLTCKFLCLSWSAAAATSPLCCSLALPPLPPRPPLEVPADLPLPLPLPLPRPRPRPLFLTGLPENELVSLDGRICRSGLDFSLELAYQNCD